MIVRMLVSKGVLANIGALLLSFLLPSGFKKELD
jgi:hypothetical protein